MADFVKDRIDDVSRNACDYVIEIMRDTTKRYVNIRGESFNERVAVRDVRNLYSLLPTRTIKLVGNYYSLLRQRPNKGNSYEYKGQRHITKGKGQRHSLAFHSDGKGKGSKGKKGKNLIPKDLKGGKGTKGKSFLGNRIMDPMSTSSAGVINISENVCVRIAANCKR
jgi:hypothetical protein